MKLAVLVEGGPGVGWGHVTRCAAVAHEVVRRGGAADVLLMGPASGLEFFPEGNKRIEDWISNPGIARQFSSEANAILLDSYRVTKDYRSTLLEGFRGMPVFFDDHGEHFEHGLVVNGAPGCETRYSPREGVRFLLGPRFQPVRSGFQNCPAKVCRSSLSRVVVTLGADDIRELAPFLYERLTAMPGNWEITMIATTVSRTLPLLRDLVRSPHRLIVDGSAETMRNAFLEADLGIIAAGQTTFETATCGLPVVLISVIDNQRPLVSGWAAAGYAPLALNFEEVRVPGVLETRLENLAPQRARQILANKGQSIVDGLGLKRIVDAIEECLLAC